MVKNPPANSRASGDAGSISGSRRSPEGGHVNPLMYSCLENPMDRGAWSTVHGVTKLYMTERLSQVRRSEISVQVIFTHGCSPAF